MPEELAPASTRASTRGWARELCCGALAWLLGAAALARAEGEWLEVSAPSEGETLRAASGIVELRGRVGSGARRAYDVVLAIDRSQSTLLPSGLDLDGDGTVGTFTLPGQGDGVCGRGTHYETSLQTSCRPFRTWTTDFDDTVVQAEHRLARVLLAELEAHGARAALVSFGGKARVDVELGPPAQALAALAARTIREDPTGSDLGAAITRALRVLAAAPDAARSRAIVLLTDGLPSSPGNERSAARAARSAAVAARDAGVALYVFQMRSEEEDPDTALLAEMAEMTAGRRIYVEVPERLAFALPSPSTGRPVGVEIHNRTLDRPARALRLHAGGAFDAFVPLADGENALEIRARLPDGRTLELRRTVYFQKSAAPSDQVRLANLLEELRKRALESEYAPRPGDVEDAARRSLRVRTARDGENVEGVPVAPAGPGGEEPGAP